MTSEAPTLNQVLTLARRLNAADRLRLIAQLAPELIATLPNEESSDSWDELFSFSDELAVLPPLTADSADVLSSMRR
jgi:hypothetical protein